MRLTLVCRRPAVSTIRTSDVAGARRLGRVVDDCGRVGPFTVPDQLSAGAAGPDLELIGRRGAKRVRGREQHLAAVRAQAVGQLPDRGRLPRPVHPEQHDHRGPRLEHERRGRAEGRDEDLPQRRSRRVRRADAGAHLFAEARDDGVRRPHAEIGLQQDLFELVVVRRVELSAQQVVEPRRQGLPRAREALPKLAEPSARP